MLLSRVTLTIISMPPWHGGGEMIVSVTLERSMFKKAPHRFEAGTPSIGDAIGLAAAIDYIEHIGRVAIFEHDSELARYAAERLAELPGTRVFGPKEERKSTRLNSSHITISYAVFCLKKKKKNQKDQPL